MASTSTPHARLPPSYTASTSRPGRPPVNGRKHPRTRHVPPPTCVTIATHRHAHHRYPPPRSPSPPRSPPAATLTVTLRHAPRPLTATLTARHHHHPRSSLTPPPVPPPCFTAGITCNFASSPSSPPHRFITIIATMLPHHSFTVTALTRHHRSIGGQLR